MFNYFKIKKLKKQARHHFSAYNWCQRMSVNPNITDEEQNEYINDSHEHRANLEKIHKQIELLS